MKYAPLVAILGGLLLLFGSKLPDFKVVPESIEGTTLYLIHEKRNPTASRVLDVRKAPAFVTEHKLAGFVNQDDDEPTLQDFLKEVAEKYKITPPMLVAQKGDTEVVRVRKWESGLEDILK